MKKQKSQIILDTQAFTPPSVDLVQLAKFYGELYRSRVILDDLPIVFWARLPLAPSANRLTTNTGAHNRRVKLSSVERWHQKAFGIIVREAQHTGFNMFRYQCYRLTLLHTFGGVQSFNQSDTDNRTKQCQDTVCKALGRDDSCIFDVRTVKLGLGMFVEPSTYVFLQGSNEPDRYNELISILESQGMLL